MVCVPCFIIPVLLYIWHRFIQPIMLKYWNPWEKKDEQGNVIKTAPEFPFQCKGGVCPFPGVAKKPEQINEVSNSTGNSAETTSTIPSPTSTASAITTDDSKKEK